MSPRRKTSVILLLATLSTALFTQDLRAEAIHWRNNLDTAKVEAARTGKLVLLHFYTSSCGPCKKLERDVFSQPQIAAAMEQDYIPVKLNADQSPALAHAFQISRVPTEVVLTAQGNIVQKLTCPLEPNAYGSQLVNVAQHYRQRSNNRTVSAQAPIHSAYAGLKIGQPNNTPSATAVPAVNKVPLAPVVTKNPYVAAAPPAITPTAPAPAFQQQTSAPAVAAKKAISNRYAAVPAAAPVASQAPVTPTPTTPPVASAVASVVAPPKTQATTPPATQQVAAAPVVAAEVWPPQLPPNVPQLAFDGYCPVSLQQAQKWVRGDKAFGAIHRGRTYLFVGETQRQKFVADPDAYSPVFSGNDAVKMLDEKRASRG